MSQNSMTLPDGFVSITTRDTTTRGMSWSATVTVHDDVVTLNVADFTGNGVAVAMRAENWQSILDLLQPVLAQDAVWA